MNPLEERLHEYLNQFDDEPWLTPSLRRVVALDHPSQPKKKLVHQGDVPMNNSITPSPTRVRIYSHVTQSRFFHVEDALSISKIRIFAGNYRKGHGMDEQGYAHAFVDIADARVIFGALACGEQNFSHKEYKGTPPQKGKGAVSRVLSIVVKGDNVYIELKSGPGKLTPTGAITPNGPAQVEVNVAFKLHEARRMAATVLAYIQAWDVLRILAHKQIVGQPAPYTTTPLSTSLLVATSSDNNCVPNMTTKPENSVAQANGTGKLQTSMANGRPVTRKSSGQANGNVAKPGNGKPTVQQPLKYGNGTLVDGKNMTEVETFQRYTAEKQSVPASKTMLLNYYRQRSEVTAVSL